MLTIQDAIRIYNINCRIIVEQLFLDTAQCFIRRQPIDTKYSIYRHNYNYTRLIELFQIPYEHNKPDIKPSESLLNIEDQILIIGKNNRELYEEIQPSEVRCYHIHSAFWWISPKVRHQFAAFKIFLHDNI